MIKLPGKCVLEHGVVNAPGTPKITIFPSLHMSARLTLFSGPPSINSMLGIESPTYNMIYRIFRRKSRPIIE